MNARNRVLSTVIQETKNSTIKITIYFLPFILVAKHRDLYESNSEICNINTRLSSDLHNPTENLTAFQIEPFYFGIKVFNLFLLASKIHLKT